MRPRNKVPSYRRHSASGQAVASIYSPNGARRDVYLGEYGTEESKAAYLRLLAGDESVAGSPATSISIAELIVKFLDHAEMYYRHADGSVTSEYRDFKYSLRPLRQLYGLTPAASFGPRELQVVRAAMIDAGWSRKLINQRIGRVKRAFKWAVAEALVPPQVWHGLSAVAGLRHGRTEAKELPPVEPVSWQTVQATLPHLHPLGQAMVLLGWHCGCRPQDICNLRTCDVDTLGEIWAYRPARHKTAWRGKTRIVMLGPNAQKVLVPLLLRDEPEAYVFSPARAVKMWRLRPGNAGPKGVPHAVTV